MSPTKEPGMQLEEQESSSPSHRSHNVDDWERQLSLALGAGTLLLALRGRGRRRWIWGALAGFLGYRGVTGYCPATARIQRWRAGHGLIANREPLHFTTGVTVSREPEDLYQFWHGLSRLPEFMKFIREVRPIGDDRTHWVAEGPGGVHVEWDSEIVQDVPNERIAWRSVPGSDVRQQGEIRFRPAPVGRGTEVELDLRYERPEGRLSAAPRAFLAAATREAAREDLRRFKRLMESGEIATNSLASRADGQEQEARP